MDSVPRDLRDALPDVDLETNQLSARSASCWKCKSRPAHGIKLRYCGGCESAAYCSKPCARADWETHKPTCERLRQLHEGALAEYVAQGGRAKDFNQRCDDLQSWFQKVPGLTNEIELMAWINRSQSPIICATPSDTDVDGSTVRVKMFPRSFWDEDPRFLDMFTAAHREVIRMPFGEASFSASEKYICVLRGTTFMLVAVWLPPCFSFRLLPINTLS